MNGILIALLVVVVLAVVLIAWIVGLYNGLVVLKNRFKNAFAQIDVQLRRRYDLISFIWRILRVKNFFQQSCCSSAATDYHRSFRSKICSHYGYIPIP